MKTRCIRSKLILLTVILFCNFFSAPGDGQEDQASLLLDLKKARAAYEIAQQKLAE